MAQRSSRSNKKKSRKQPELRTGGGRQAKAERTRAREASGTSATQAGPVVRVRPAGAGGMLVMHLVAYLGVALVAYVGALIARWDILSYPDSLWLYAAFGFAAVAPAVGRVARGRTDANAWGAQALLIPLGLFAAESVMGPECPAGGSCASIGARGALGIFGTVLVILVLAAVAWGLARWTAERAARNRPSQGRVRYSALIASMVLGILFIGGPLTIAFGGVDILVRDTPTQVKDASYEVANHCFALGEQPALDVRAAPEGIYSDWTTYAVRQADEERTGVKGAKLPGNWADLNGLHPYEATTTFDADGDVVSIECRKIAPDAGTATAEDLTPNVPASDPLPLDTIRSGSQFFPQFYTQAPPTAEQLATSKKTLEDARKAAAKEAADAKKPAAETPAK